MSLYENYKTEKKLESEGIRISKGCNEDGTEIVFIVARSGRGNTSFKLAQERAFKPKRDAIRQGKLSNSEAEAMLLDLFCGHVLKGWENVRDENGKEMPFNSENAKKLMVDLPDLYEELQLEANNMQNFLSASREDDAKN